MNKFDYISKFTGLPNNPFVGSPMKPFVGLPINPFVGLSINPFVGPLHLGSTRCIWVRPAAGGPAVGDGL